MTAHFNPAGYGRLRENYAFFAERLAAQGVDLWTVEVAFGAEPHALPAHERCLQLRTDSVLWLKERALNVLLARLPSAYDAVAWLDADILFDDNIWTEDARALLGEAPVIQCFGAVTHLTRERRHTGRMIPSVARAWQEDGPTDDLRFAPGFAWAARRELLAKHGLYDAHVLGANDRLLAIALLNGGEHPYLLSNMNQAMREHFACWARAIHADILGRVGCLDGTIRHLWHGRLDERNYLERNRILIDAAFDPSADIATGPDGLWRWTSPKERLHSEVLRYFLNRNEDGNDPTNIASVKHMSLVAV